MSSEIYLLTLSLPLLTAVIVFSMKYASSYAAARAVQAERNDIKALVEAQGAQLTQVTASLKSIERQVALQSRDLSSIDSILKQVG